MDYYDSRLPGDAPGLDNSYPLGMSTSPPFGEQSWSEPDYNTSPGDRFTIRREYSDLCPRPSRIELQAR